MAFDEVRCLRCNPFEGDFGSPGDTILQDKMVTCLGLRKRHCHMCNAVIAKGERIRNRVEIVDRELAAYFWCSACCAAMAAYPDDQGEAIEARIILHPNMAQYVGD